MNNDSSAELECPKCDGDLHYCGGCGDPLRHDGKEFSGSAHQECT